MNFLDDPEYRYGVVEFPIPPRTGMAKWAYVPYSWIHTKKMLLATDDPVNVSYPDEDSRSIEKRIQNCEGFEDGWDCYQAVFKTGTDFYDEAKRYVDAINKFTIENRQPGPITEGIIPLTVTEITSSTQQTTPQYQVTQTPNNKGETLTRPNKITAKRLTVHELPAPNNSMDYTHSDKPSVPCTITQRKASEILSQTERNAENRFHELQTPIIQTLYDNATNRRDAITENRLENQIANQPEYNTMQALSQSHHHTVTPIRSMGSRNYNDNEAGDFENNPGNIQFSVPKSAQSPQIAPHQVNGTNFSQQVLNNLFDLIRNMNTNICNLSNRFLEILEQINNINSHNNARSDEHRRGNHVELKRSRDSHKDKSNDEDQVPVKKLARKNSYVPSSESVHDENDSKWTLKYPKRGPNLVELLPCSRVYVKKTQLENCKKEARDCMSLACMLLFEVFSTRALKQCAFTGAKSSTDVKKRRPGLDEHARLTLLTFVAQHGKEKRWLEIPPQALSRSLALKIIQFRRTK